MTYYPARLSPFGNEDVSSYNIFNEQDATLFPFTINKTVEDLAAAYLEYARMKDDKELIGNEIEVITYDHNIGTARWGDDFYDVKQLSTDEVRRFKNKLFELTKK